jgi:cysteine desulfurase
MADKYIYLDNAATTRVRDEVYAEAEVYLKENYANPSAKIYHTALNAKKAVELARERTSRLIGADMKEIYFTASGTEAINWAIRGAAEASRGKGNHIITTAIEHHAVTHTCEYLAENGFQVTYLPVDKDGLVDPEDVRKAIKAETILVSVMYANNEIGTIQPIERIGEIARTAGVLFHTDAVAAAGHIPIDTGKIKIDLLTLSGHKFGAMKGVGALYIRKGVNIAQFIYGGSQERGRRAGTENVAAIVSMGRAALESSELEKEAVRLESLRDKLIKGIMENIPHTELNGHAAKRLPGNVNISFEFIEGESLLLLLSMKGIYASSGSACASDSLDPSHVLLAIGLPHERAHGSLRLSLGYDTTDAEIDRVLAELPPIVERLRQMSPLYNK